MLKKSRRTYEPGQRPERVEIVPSKGKGVILGRLTEGTGCGKKVFITSGSNRKNLTIGQIVTVEITAEFARALHGTLTNETT